MARGDERIGWPTLAGLGLVVGAFIVLSLLVTATGTARFAVAVGYGANVGYAVGAIFDVAKGMLPVALLALLARRALGTSTLLGAAWVCLVVFSCLATHATVSTAISTIERTGTWKMEVRGSTKAELTTVEQQLAALSRPTPPRPAKTVREALVGERVPSGIWRNSQECGSIQESFHFAKACAQVVQLRRELAASEDYERLSARATELRKGLAEAPIVATSDPLPAAYDATLGRFVPIGGTEGVALLLTAVVELMSSFGLAALSVLYHAKDHERARVPDEGSQQANAGAASGKSLETTRDPAHSHLPEAAQVIRFPSAQERSGVRPPPASNVLPEPALCPARRDSGQTRRSAHHPAGEEPAGEAAARPVRGPAQGGADRHAAARAVRAFVKLLETEDGARATGSELFYAYAAQRLAHGWPELKPNVFGVHAKAAVAELGGRKFKSGGQIYKGVRIPAAWRAQVARSA